MEQEVEVEVEQEKVLKKVELQYIGRIRSYMVHWVHWVQYIL